MIVEARNGRDGSAYRAPIGWMPVALALAATALLAGYLATGPHGPNIVMENGIARQDESTVARIWQLLMLGQLPFIVAFAAIWLPKDPARALRLLALQVLAFAGSAAPLLLLEA